MTGILALKKYYRQMETKELERERSEIERELVSRKKDRQLKTALALINNELSNRIIRDRENLLNQQCPKSFPILSDHNIETGEHMTVTIDSLPVDANDLTEEQCVLYLSVIISVCRADGLSEAETVRVEGAPIPMKPLKKWDNGRNVLLAGDAAGVVAPASGEGIYYAMTGGKIAAETVSEFLATQDVRVLAKARKSFMKKHGKVFWVLGIMQKFWYCSDKRRERFVSICKDKDVQDLTWQSYMHKKLERKKPLAHARIFFKDLAHLLGVART